MFSRGNIFPRRKWLHASSCEGHCTNLDQAEAVNVHGKRWRFFRTRLSGAVKCPWYRMMLLFPSHTTDRW